jgi:hypothetical protein
MYQCVEHIFEIKTRWVFLDFSKNRNVGAGLVDKNIIRKSIFALSFLWIVHVMLIRDKKQKFAFFIRNKNQQKYQTNDGILH